MPVTPGAPALSTGHLESIRWGKDAISLCALGFFFHTFPPPHICPAFLNPFGSLTEPLTLAWLRRGMEGRSQAGAGSVCLTRLPALHLSRLLWTLPPPPGAGPLPFLWLLADPKHPAVRQYTARAGSRSPRPALDTAPAPHTHENPAFTWLPLPKVNPRSHFVIALPPAPQASPRPHSFPPSGTHMASLSWSERKGLNHCLQR